MVGPRRRDIRGTGNPLGTGVLSPKVKFVSLDLDRSADYASVSLHGYHRWCSEGAAPTVSNEPSPRPGGLGCGGGVSPRGSVWTLGGRREGGTGRS